MGGFSVWHWLIVLLIVVLVFGTKKLGNIGSDLGRAIREFKKGLGDDEAGKDKPAEPKLKADAPEAKVGDKVESENRDRVD